MRKIFSLDYILTRGARVYDIISIISLSAGINFLTEITFEPHGSISASMFCSILIGAILFIASGIGFSWLSYWIKRYLEDFSGHHLVDALEKIRNENKEKEFRSYFILSWIFFVLAVLSALVRKL